jgi:uncharacterized protein YdaU (DUF1376 family)
VARHEADIWMPLDIGKYLGDTMHLTTLQHGAYLLLLMDYWKRGPMQNDERQLAAITRMDATSIAWADAWAVLKQYFPLADDGLLHNAKADKEIAKATSNQAVASEKAKNAALKRWSKGCSKDATSIAQALPQNAPSPSPSDINTNPPNPPRGERKKRRSRTEILSPYPPEVSELVNDILPNWPKVQPKDRSPIHFDVPMTAERIDGLLREPGVTAEILKQAASKYLGEQKNYYRAPQFFFGPGAGEKSPPWVAYARMTVHQEAQRGIN